MQQLVAAYLQQFHDCVGSARDTRSICTESWSATEDRLGATAQVRVRSRTQKILSCPLRGKSKIVDNSVAIDAFANRMVREGSEGGQGCQRILAISNPVQVLGYRYGARTTGGSSTIYGFTDRSHGAIYLNSRLLCRDERETLGVLKKSAGRHRLEQVEGLSVRHLMPFAQDKYHATGAHVSKPGARHVVSKSMLTEQPGHGRGHG